MHANALAWSPNYAKVGGGGQQEAGWTCAADFQPKHLLEKHVRQAVDARRRKHLRLIERDQPADVLARAGAAQRMVGPRGAEELRPRRADAEEDEELRPRANTARNRDRQVYLNRRRHTHFCAID